MIDTDGIRKAASGDKTKKVSVTKAWLIAVADELDRNRKTSSEKRLDSTIESLLKGYRK